MLFVSIATMAPGAGAAYAIMSGAPFAGGSLPLAVLIALMGCVLVAVSVGQLAKHMASAAGLASYVGKAFHGNVGFITAWAYPIVYLCVRSLTSASSSATYSPARYFPAKLARDSP